MNAWNPALYRSWFVVAQSRRLKSKPLSVTLLDRPLVLARLQSGTLLALDDCCPHRHAPLSAGRVTAAGLQCGYHGWTFGADGRCTALPGLAEHACQPAVQVGSLDVMEYDGFIWVRPEASGSLGSQDLPAFLRRLPPASRRFIWSATWKAHAVDALENFLDPLHTHFVHSGLVRAEGNRQRVEATVTRSAGVLQVDYRGQPQQSGWLYRLFESPRELERAHFAGTAAGSAQLEYRYQDSGVLYFTLHFSPVSATLTQVHGTLHVENRWAPEWAVRTLAWPFLRRVARQDQKIVELQAANKTRFRREAGVSTELDLVRPSLDEVWAVPARPLTEHTRRVDIML
ncbi:phenylpropionate dioxygenase-like ring-hydroxylating dioxygenase large terminal subunit [Paraburkholderia sp. GAS41]|jgi:phenylpropionate dioxygenase-like ring-hydroxylating dioxygenase large terminal subunit|uniref:Rieske 2Fe-2S domain-containing protein n=1 Tax=Paraburkholderia sp. GAS41 TaxID=3035134 RepID=UPI003D1F8A6D